MGKDFCVMVEEAVSDRGELFVEAVDAEVTETGGLVLVGPDGQTVLALAAGTWLAAFRPAERKPW